MSDRPNRRAPASESDVWKWTLAAGAASLLLGLAMVALPIVDRTGFAAAVGWILAASGLAEGAADLRGRRFAEYRSLLFLPVITLCAALAIILNPLLNLVTMLQLVTAIVGARALGAWIAAAQSGSGRRAWLLGRAIGDTALTLILLTVTPTAALVVLLFGEGWSWAAAEALGLSLGASLVVAGITWMGLSTVERNTAMLARSAAARNGAAGAN